MTYKKMTSNAKNRRVHILLLLVLGMIFSSLPADGSVHSSQNIQVPRLALAKGSVATVKVINTYPHDEKAFTQGLFFHRGKFYESTGLYANSALLMKDIKTGRPLREIKIDPEYFGEGAVGLKNKIFQLTWRNETLIVYDAGTFRKIKKIKYSGEGWGLTTDGEHLLMSNGSSIITYRNPDTFKVIREIKVHDGDQVIEGLNELEFIKGEIWANIFMEDLMVRIDPVCGKVKGWVDLSSLRSWLPRDARVDVLNGIAFEKKTGRIFVTGKLWPKLFEIRLVK